MEQARERVEYAVGDAGRRQQPLLHLVVVALHLGLAARDAEALGEAADEVAAAESRGVAESREDDGPRACNAGKGLVKVVDERARR